MSENVYFDKTKGRWKAQVGSDYRDITLGYADTEQGARDILNSYLSQRETKLYSTGEVAAEIGVCTPTLWYWHNRGLYRAASQTSGSHRRRGDLRYTAAQLRWLKKYIKGGE